MKVVGFGGSRECGDRGLVESVVAFFLRRGWSVSVGCAVGADEAVIEAVLGAGAARRLSVFSAFGPWGLGSWRGSAVEAVSRAGWEGARVKYWAGGDWFVPLRAALARRSVALAESGLSLFVAFPGSYSRGTWVAVRAAVAAGVQVVVFPLPGLVFPLPDSSFLSLGEGRWVRSFWGLGWRWLPAASQPSLL